MPSAAVIFLQRMQKILRREPKRADIDKPIGAMCDIHSDFVADPCLEIQPEPSTFDARSVQGLWWHRHTHLMQQLRQ